MADNGKHFVLPRCVGLCVVWVSTAALWRLERRSLMEVAIGGRMRGPVVGTLKKYFSDSLGSIVWVLPMVGSKLGDRLQSVALRGSMVVKQCGV